MVVNNKKASRARLTSRHPFELAPGNYTNFSSRGSCSFAKSRKIIVDSLPVLSSFSLESLMWFFFTFLSGLFAHHCENVCSHNKVNQLQNYYSLLYQYVLLKDICLVDSLFE